MRECPNCGRSNPESEAFCQCGEYLQWELTGSIAGVSYQLFSPDGGESDQTMLEGEPRVCPNCEYENGPEIDFCENCEQYLRWEIIGSLPRVKAMAG